MNEIIRNKYILEESELNSITNTNDDIELNLKLTPNLNTINFSRIIGTVFNEHGESISNSIIKLESLDKNLKLQAITDNNGQYAFENVSENFYIVSIWANNMVAYQSEKIQVIRFNTYNLNFTLKEIQNADSIITGDVLDSSNNNSIYNVEVLLFKIENTQRILKSICYTNEFGQFAFRKVLNGNYFLVFNMHGYLQYFTNISITNSFQIVSLKVNMLINDSEIGKIISGVIVDEYGNPLQGIFVSLYIKTSDISKETVAGVTKTNSDGIYVFTNIPKGIYRVAY